MSQLKLNSLAITATATAAPLSATDLWCSSFVVQNIDSANEVYIGNSSVSSSNGFKLDVNGAVGSDNLLPSDRQRLWNLKDVYAICAGAETATLRVLYVTESF